MGAHYGREGQERVMVTEGAEDTWGERGKEGGENTMGEREGKERVFGIQLCCRYSLG